MSPLAPPTDSDSRSLIDELLAEQRNLTAVDRFARWHESPSARQEAAYRRLIPLTAPRAGEQYRFDVDLDRCSGCKACVTACHSLNGLDEAETWRGVGLLVSLPGSPAAQQHVTTACHHCVDPACLNGCPVLAYDKDPDTGIVRHLDDQCIGCQYCVMKCPYEVPKYSDRLGIVRKCDMCAGRLAVGEAPACVQACPSEAIRITVVDQDAVAEKFRRPDAPVSDSVPALFLPDSPDPRLTLPATRYHSTRPLAKLLGADHGVPRLEPPHWPLILMLVLTQAAAGLSLVSAVLAAYGLREARTPLGGASLGLLAAGLGAAVLHLGRPAKAWRSFLGWRTSWLSREIITLNFFACAALVVFVAPWIPPLVRLAPPLLALAALAGLAGVFASAMVYVDTGRPLWSARSTIGNFFGTTALLGAAFSAAVLGWTGRAAETNLAPAAQWAAVVVIIIRVVLFVGRGLALHLALHHTASPRHLAARVVHRLLPGTQRACGVLFISSIAFGLLAAANAGRVAPAWASLVVLTTFSSEFIGRFIFFVASASKRMPGGIAT